MARIYQRASYKGDKTKRGPIEANQMSATCILSINQWDDKITVYVHAENRTHGRERAHAYKGFVAKSEGRSFG